MSLGLAGLLLWGGRGLDHGLQDAAAGVDEPVVDLQEGEVGLRCNVTLLILTRVRVLGNGDTIKEGSNTMP